MRSRSKQLARHSINSALAAIEIYNKPAFPDREKVFAVLMVTAWEALLKARILHLAKNKLTSLFVREKAKRFKRNRNKIPFTVDIYEAMRRLNLDPVVASNIGHLVEIRDSAVHLTVESPSLPQIVFSLGTTTLRNYARLVHEWFNMPLSSYNFYIMPLAFATPFRTLRLADVQSEPDDIAQIIESLTHSQEELPPSKDFYFLCEVETALVSSKRISQTTDLVAAIDATSPDVVFVQKPISPLDQYPYSGTQVAKLIKDELPDVKRNDVWKAIKALSLKGDKRCSKYSCPTKAAESLGSSRATGVIYNHDAFLALLAYFRNGVEKTGAPS
jgi:hypothetical protein